MTNQSFTASHDMSSRWHRIRVAAIAALTVWTLAGAGSPVQAQGPWSPYPVTPQQYWGTPAPILIVPGPSGYPSPCASPGIVILPAVIPGTRVVQTFRPVLPDAQLRIMLSEDFVNTLISSERVDSGPVRDCILGANVTGDQVTNTRVTIDFQSCDQAGNLLVLLNGTVRNSTVGITPQAAVHSAGLHDLQLSKQVTFDGRQFTTRSPSAWITPRIAHRAAETPVSGVPLVGPIASTVAIREAERMRPAAESIAANRITSQVGPQFNQAVDQELSQGNRLLAERILPLLQDWHLLPAAPVVSTSESDLSYEARLTAGGTPPATPAPEADPQAGIAFAIHESYLNDALSQLALAGREMTDRSIDGWFEQELPRLLPSVRTSAQDVSENENSGPRVRPDVRVSQPGVGESDTAPHEVLRAPGFPVPTAPELVPVRQEPEGVTIVLYAKQPLRVRFEDGACIVVARAGFRTMGVVNVPPQQVEIRYQVILREGTLILEPGSVDVTSFDGSEESTVAELARPIIRQQVERRLRTLTLPARIPLSLPDLTGRDVTITGLSLEAGWLVLSFH